MKSIPFSCLTSFFPSLKRVFCLKTAKIVLLLVCVAILVIIRIHTHSFNVGLRYIYMLLINIGAFWFGLKGGIGMSVLSVLIFFMEISLFPGYGYTDVASQFAVVRFIAYFSGGIIIGYLSDNEKKIKEQREEYKSIAFRDELTGCMNYRFVIELLERKILESRRYGREMTIVMLDIDYFKEINDQYGHIVGNKFLKWFTSILCNSVREIDMVGRYGGDEFLVILPDFQIKQTLIVLERIKKKLSSFEAAPANILKYMHSPMRFSAGVVSFPDHGQSVDELINAVDDLLYQAKRRGRNTVVVERRSSIRLKKIGNLNIEIKEEKNTKESKGVELQDISRLGMSFFVTRDIQSHGCLCRIYLPDVREPLQVPCKIVYKEKKKQNSFRIGVIFLNIPKKLEKYLDNYIGE
jgi:diguanylate cyclase (GGDEF)-like protein